MARRLVPLLVIASFALLVFAFAGLRRRRRQLCF